MSAFEIGTLQIDRVEELYGPNMRASDFLSGLPLDAIHRNIDWLSPSCYDQASGLLITTIQRWIVRTRHHIVLIDTCTGNDKERPTIPTLHRLATPWLKRLADKGIRPAQVDFVMCTHLHADHAGWNTHLVDGRWIPTFPNAKYLFARHEFHHWDPSAGAAVGFGQQGVFADSVLPCLEAGLVALVDDGFELDDALSVEAAPGHTAGNTIIRARSQGATGLFIGDCMHTPLQIAYPDVNTIACENPEQARATRRRLLSECAEYRHLLVPAHFPVPFIGRVSRRGDSYRYLPGA
jgi:glyoxylase-like metal-dependent hydrolase (beta-lactamase superfamily II)